MSTVREEFGNLFDRGDGRGVMGARVARQAKQRFGSLPVKWRFMEPADPFLIHRSLAELVALPMCLQALDDRFIVVERMTARV